MEEKEYLPFFDGFSMDHPITTNLQLKEIKSFKNGAVFIRYITN